MSIPHICRKKDQHMFICEVRQSFLCMKTPTVLVKALEGLVMGFANPTRASQSTKAMNFVKPLSKGLAKQPSRRSVKHHSKELHKTLHMGFAKPLSKWLHKASKQGALQSLSIRGHVKPPEGLQSTLSRSFVKCSKQVTL